MVWRKMGWPGLGEALAGHGLGMGSAVHGLGWDMLCFYWAGLGLCHFT
jgi:hypothetical protein